MADTKQKSFKIPTELAIEFEVQAKRTQTKEVDLAIRYIREGLKRDVNQTTLD
jgi:hypothetical protein